MICWIWWDKQKHHEVTVNGPFMALSQRLQVKQPHQGNDFIKSTFYHLRQTGRSKKSNIQTRFKKGGEFIRRQQQIQAARFPIRPRGTKHIISYWIKPDQNNELKFCKDLRGTAASGDDSLWVFTSNHFHIQVVIKLPPLIWNIYSTAT